MTGAPENNRTTSVIADMAAAILFFTRLPVPVRLPRDHGPPDMGRIARVVPVVGLIVGVISASMALVAWGAAFPPLGCALLALGAAALLTGAMHEDGLADVADGFGGGWTRERKLEIMKDSRVGSYGVTAVIVVLGLEAALIADILGRTGPIAAFVAIIAAATLSRVAALAPMALLPPARTDGLAAAAGAVSPRDLAIGALFACLLAGVGLVVLFGVRGAPLALLVCVTAASITAILLTRLAKAQIGGHTGDVAGATQKLASVAVLAALVVTLPPGIT
jgi:adenosylcobinamide-GDP ribazoletransferase